MSLVQQIHEKNRHKAGATFGYVMLALAAARGDMMTAIERSQQYKGQPLVEGILRAGIATKGGISAGSTSDANFASSLAIPVPIASEMADLLYPYDALTQMLALGCRRYQFNSQFLRFNVGSTSAVTAAGAPAAVSAASLETLTLPIQKIVAIVVITEETAKGTFLDAALTLSNDMAKSIGATRNRAALDLDTAGSLLHGATQFASSGISIDNIADDFGKLEDTHVGNGIPLRGCVVVTSERFGAYLGRLRGTNKQFVFPGISSRGGELFGYPVITTTSAVESGSPTEAYFSLVHLDSIAVAMDNTPFVDATREASIQMDSAPSGSASAQVSLFAHNLVAIRATLFANWIRARDIGVATVRSVNI